MIDYIVYGCILVKYICSIKLRNTYFQRTKVRIHVQMQFAWAPLCGISNDAFILFSEKGQLKMHPFHEIHGDMQVVRKQWKLTCVYYSSRVSNNRTASIQRTYWKTWFHMACKEWQFDVVELMVNDQFKTFSINLNAQHVNGMTPFDLAIHMYGY